MIINRYLVRELSRPLVVVLGILVTLFASYSATGFLSDAVDGLLPTGEILELIVLKILISLEVLIPASLYISVMLSFARLYGESEFAAMSALRVKPATMMRAVLTLSGYLALVVAGLSLFVRPLAYAKLHEIAGRTADLIDVDSMEAGSFYVAGHGTRVIFLGHRDGPGLPAHDVFLRLQYSDRTEIVYARLARMLPQATPETAPQVYLSDNHIYEIERKNGEADQFWQAQGLVVNPDRDDGGRAGYSAVAASSRHLVTSDSMEDVAELQWRLSTPVSTLLLGLLGIPLSRTTPRKNKHSRFTTAILVYFGYYLLCTSARTWVQHGAIGTLPGIWWAPLVLSLFLLYASYRQSPRFSFTR